MILYIAEKPSLGRAIADVLPKPHKKGEGYITAANGDCVSWCIGHLLEQAEPDAYDDKYKSWRLEDLPIIPSQWKLKPKSKTRSQLTVLRKLVKQASEIVNAGDPDREGQLLVDEVIAHLGVKGTKLQSVKRLLISDLNPSAVKRALGQLRDNRDFIPLSTSALARSRADWLYGMNMTRAYTIQGKKVGYQGVLSVGRVQTPILGLIVRRDEEIANFVAKPYFEVLAHLVIPEQLQSEFTAKWQPSKACEPYQDDEGRVLSKGLAQNVVKRITDKPASVTKLEAKIKRQNPPLPYSLSSLQIDAAKRFGMSAKAVLDTCQSLYERHKLITYPRSDSRYLPKEQLKLVSSVVKAVVHNAAELIPNASQPNLALVSKAWNDAKVEAHHAIVPTEKKANLAVLSVTEANIYRHIARQYLAQFYPAYVYDETYVEIDISGGRFTTKAKVDKALGWKVLFGKSASSNDGNQVSPSDENENMSSLPPLTVGQTLYCSRGQCLDKMTQPPKHFTDATLLSAMTGISRFVSDADIKKTLKETDGLGTEATRAGIIELLFNRGYLSRSGKAIMATDIGKGLINSLPVSATLPDMTALWEQSLDAISLKLMRYERFMQPLIAQVGELINQASQQLPLALQGVSAPMRKSWTKGRKATATKGRKTAKRKPTTKSKQS